MYEHKNPIDMFLKSAYPFKKRELKDYITKDLIIILISSSSLILLEILLMNIYSAFILHSFSVWIIATSTLGIGLGAAISSYKKYDISLYLSLLLPLSIFLIYFSLTQGILNNPNLLSVSLNSILLSVPFTLIGYILTNSLKKSKPNRAIFTSSMGSAVPLFILYKIIPAIGALKLLFFVSLLLPLTLTLIVPKRKKKILIFFSILILLSAFLYWGSSGLKISKDPNKTNRYNMGVFDLLKDNWKVIDTHWSGIGRTDLLKKDGRYAVTQGGSKLIVPQRNSYSDKIKPCLFRNYSKILFVGSGTDMEINLLKKKYPNSEIVSVEINGKIVDYVKNRLSNYSTAYNNVSIEIMDGRNYIEKTNSKFDLIVFSHVDSPSYLYYMNIDDYIFTKEGISEFLNHLNPNGTLCIAHNTNPWRKIYLPTLLKTSKYNLKNPEEKIFYFSSSKVVQNEIIEGDETIHIILNKDGISKKESKKIKEKIRSLIKYQAYFNKSSDSYFAPQSDKKLPELNKKIATDDRPYIYRSVNSFRIRPIEKNIIIFSLTISLLSLVSSFLFLRLKDQKPSYLLLFCIPFLGVGYLMLEAALIQKVTLFFKNPIIASSTVLPIFLVFNGIGSLLSKKIEKMKFPIYFLIPPLVLISFFFLDLATSRGVFYTNPIAKNFFIFLIITPIAFILGMPFPYILDKINKDSIPIFYSLDAVFGTLGNIGALMISIVYGFRTTFIAIGAIYLLACLFLYLGASKNPI